MVDPDTAGVLTDRGVRRSESRGREWKDVNPRGFDPASLHAAFFLDRLQAWALSLDRNVPGRVTVLRTADGGSTWQTSSFVADFGDQEPGDSARMFFLDSRNGWLLATALTSSAGSRAVLYRTDDGGRTWKRAADTVSGAVRFVDSARGWLAGGPASSLLLSTRDGGQTWAEQDVPQKSDQEPWRTTVSVPSFFDSQRGVLTIEEGLSTLTADLRLHFYVTSDGGVTWRAAGAPLQATGSGIFLRNAPRFSAVGNRTWFLSLADGLHVTRDGGSSWSLVATDADLSNVLEIDFVSPNVGIAYWVKRDCPPRSETQSARCSETTGLLATNDGGRTWKAMNLQ